MEESDSLDADLDAFGTPDGGDPFDTLLREAAHVPPMSIPMPERGTLLSGRFEVVRRLGQGGMGVVYQVTSSRNTCGHSASSMWRRLCPRRCRCAMY